jgi:hypothetical protein
MLSNISNQKLIAICISLSLLVLLMDTVIPLGVAGGVPYIIVVLISLWSHDRHLPIYTAIGCSILTLAGLYTSPAGGELWKVMTNRLLALLAIWATAILGSQRIAIQEEKKEIETELNVLSGLLPICASCKKIRDDDGDWQQMEAYIRDHSEAEFSHGICPACAESLYGIRPDKQA